MAAVASDYEVQRQTNLERNKRRLSELGLQETKRRLSSLSPAPGGNISHSNPISKPGVVRRLSLTPPEPVRRSARLVGVKPVYVNPTDALVDEKKVRQPRLTSGDRPEVYTDKHKQALGSYTTPWVLFQDGYKADGTRVYDMVSGKTCHQCRQKTLGKRSECSRCQAKQGQFCGDCLFMRYGENVDEALTNAEWVCPICRDICNCSICRPKKGWGPTGQLYKSVVAHGHASVAHYLVDKYYKAESDDADATLDS